MKFRYVVLILGVIVTADACNQLQAAVEWEHQAWLGFASLDLVAGALLVAWGLR